MLEWQQRVVARYLLVAELRVDIISQLVMRRNHTKKEIVRNKIDIDRIFKEGKSISCFGMRLIYLDNNLGYDRIIVIPAKHFGRAVDRNKARRRAKEVFRNYPYRNSSLETHVNDSKDYALIMYPGKVSDFSLLESGFTGLLDRANRR